MNSIYGSPGQKVRLLLQIVNSLGIRVNTSIFPTIDKIIFPNGDEDGYSEDMTNLDIGIYYFDYTIPKGTTSIGTFILLYSYLDPDTDLLKQDLFSIVVTAPFGLYSASPI